MTKQQQKQIEFIKAHVSVGNIDAAARGLSALIRCALNSKQSQELKKVAIELNLTKNQEFVI